MLKKWKFLKSDTVFRTRYMSVEKRSYKLPNGKVVNDYYHLLRPDFVLIVPRDINGKILIERQYRRGTDDFVYELPAGWINEGEDPTVAAERELLEETGLKGKIKPLDKIYVQAGYSSQVVYIFLAEVDSNNKQESDPDSDEEIELTWLDHSEISKMIKKGDIKDMGMLSALELYENSLE